MKLYRGDSLPAGVTSARHRGRTFADHFCGNGLMAKFADGGSSRLLDGKDLLQLTIEHVGYDVGHPEQALADHSPMISFSESAATAFNFSDRTRGKVLDECPLEDATHFMWELDLDLPTAVESGLYAVHYEADPANCLDIVQKQLERGLSQAADNGSMDAIAKGLMNAGVMARAAADPRNHYAELIDVVPFLNARDHSHREQRLVDNTLCRSMRDREWLLYPKDPMPDGPGFSARFSMNRHLRVYGCYRVRGA